MSATTIDVINFNLKKITTFQMKSMLSFAGYNRLPTKKGDLVQLFLMALEEKPEDMTKAYDFIVLKKEPEGGDVPSAVVDYAEKFKSSVQGAISDSVRTAQKSMMSHSRVIAETLREEIQNEIVRAAKESVPERIEIKAPGKKAKEIGGAVPTQFKTVLKLAMARKNTMLIGPAGCGKTYIAEKVADALGIPFSSVSCTSGMGESELKGWLLPTGENGRFEYVQSQFIERYENGGVFLLDEIDAADPNVLVFINQALANGSFFLAHRFNNPLVKKHRDFVCIAAANTFGHGADMMYVGRNQLDAATLDRFRAGIIAMDYDPDVERKLIHPEVLQWGWGIRKKIREHKLRRIMSMRAMIDISSMIEMHGMEGWPKSEWERSYFADWSRDEVIRVGGAL